MYIKWHFKQFSFTGLTKGENLIASVHPADKLSFEAFKVRAGLKKIVLSYHNVDLFICYRI